MIGVGEFQTNADPNFSLGGNISGTQAAQGRIALVD